MFVVLVSYLERYSSSMMLISIISKACLLPSTDSTLPNMMLAFQEKKWEWISAITWTNTNCSAKKRVLFYKNVPWYPYFCKTSQRHIHTFFILPRLWQWSHQTKISPTTNRTKMWKAPYWFNHLYMLTRIKGWR